MASGATAVGQPGAQSAAPALEVPSSLQGFAGLNSATHGDSTLPDAVGDVGPNYYVQAVNTAFGVFTKAGTLQSWMTFDDLFTGASTTECQTGNHHGNPSVLYDKTDNRWIVGDLGYSDIVNGPFYQCIAVSDPGDPTTWTLFAFLADAQYLTQDLRMALWSDSIFMSANLYDCTDVGCTTPAFQGVQAWALNLHDLAVSHVLNSVYLASYLGGSYTSLLPSNLKGLAPPANTPDYYVSLDPSSSTQLDVWTFAIDWATFPDQDSGSLSGPTAVTVSSISAPPATIPQTGTGVDSLDSVGGRLMAPVQYRHVDGSESLWLSHSVTSNGVAGVRWYQLDVTGGTIATAPVQSGTYQPDTDYHRWLPSLAVDGAGDMVVGYSASSSSTNPAIRYAGRLVTDSANVLAQGEAVLKAGTGSESGASGVWGQNSSMTVDPVDDCTFWYTNEYYAADGTDWQTWIASFRFGAGGHAASDFDQDARSDPTKYVPGAGAVYHYDSCSGVWNSTFIGTDGQYIVNSDFDGDGRADPAKYVASAGAVWYLGSADSAWHGVYIGSDGEYVPSSDFDGDHITDPAKYVASAGAVWYLGSDDSTWHGVYIGGLDGGAYVPGSDFDGDGKTDPAHVDSIGNVWYLASTDSTLGLRRRWGDRPRQVRKSQHLVHGLNQLSHSGCHIIGRRHHPGRSQC